MKVADPTHPTPPPAPGCLDNDIRLMPYYISVIRLQARPMSLGFYFSIRGWKMPELEDPDSPGYRVVYQDGYQSWVPSHIFERSYMRLEDECGLSICQRDVTKFIGDGECSIIHETDRMTVCKFQMINGFETVESSACVSPENYNRDIGINNCLKRVEDSVWKYLGFMLRTAIHGFKAK